MNILARYVLIFAFWPVKIFGQDVPAQELSPTEALSQGEAAYLAADWNKADEIFTQFVDTYGEEPELQEAVGKVKSLRAICLLRLEKFQEAGPVIAECLTQSKLDDKLREEFTFWQGITLMKSGDYAGASSALMIYYKNNTHPMARRQEALLLHGACLAGAEKWADAAAFFAEKVPILQNQNTEVAGRGAVIWLHALMQQGDTSAALKLIHEMEPRLDQVTQITAWQTMVLGTGGRALDEGRLYDAISCFQRVWSADRLKKHQTARVAWVQERLTSVSQQESGEALAFQYKGMLRKINREIEQFQKISNWDTALRFRLVECYRRMDRWRECALLLDSIRAELPRSGIARQASLAAIQCWMRVGRWRKAQDSAAAYLSWYAVGPSADAATAAFYQAQCAYEDKRYAESSTLFEMMARSYPNSGLTSKAALMRGMCQLMDNQNSDAITTLTALQKVESPESEDADYWIGMALCFDGKYMESSHHLKAYLTRHGKPRYRTEVAFRLAYNKFSLKDYLGAAQGLQTWVKENPEHEFTNEARILLGDALLAEGQFAPGIAAYNAIPTSDARFYEEAQFKIGNAWKVADDKEKMRAVYAHFVKNRPHSPRVAEAVYWLGWINIKQDNPEAAQTIYLNAIQTLGADPNALGIEDILSGLDKIYAKSKGDLDAQLETLTKEAETAKNPVRLVRMLWAQANRRQSSGGSGLLMWQNLAAVANPATTSARILADTADGLRTQNVQLDDATRLYTELRRWNPYALERERASLGLANIAKYRGQNALALKWLDTFDEEKLSSAFDNEVGFSRADLYTTIGDHDKALTQLNTLLKNQQATSETKARALLALGDLFVTMNEPKKATAYYERVYVSYGKYKDLVAKAYMKRADSLLKIARKQDATDTLLEMIMRPDMAGRKDERAAKKILDQIEPKWQEKVAATMQKTKEVQQQALDPEVKL